MLKRSLFLILFYALGLKAFGQSDAVIQGVVLDSQNIVLPGVSLRLVSSGGSQWVTYSDSAGKFQFPNLKKGSYQITAELTGFQSVTSAIALEASAVRSIQIVLPLSADVKEALTVSGSSELLEKTETQEKEEVGEETIDYVPIASQRFQDVLPLIPSVVRGPDGLINVKGARATESSLLVNGSNVTDPVTGNFAIDLPIEAVESVQVYTNPYSAEYGKFSAGVTNISTKAGENRLKFELNDFIPRLHLQDGNLNGVEAWTPRVRVSGPTMFRNVYFSQAVQYKFNRTFLEDLPDNFNDIELAGLDSLTQIDYRRSDRHQITLTASVFPQNVKNVNLNTFFPLESTPNFKQRGYNVAAMDRFFFKNGSFLESSFSAKTYDVSVLPKDELGEPIQLTVEGTRGNYFNRQERDSTRIQWMTAYTMRPWSLQGSHVLRIAADVARTEYSGSISYAPVEVRSRTDNLLERVEFDGEADLQHRTTEVSAYVQDHWTPLAPLIIDWGLRLDYDGISKNANLGPRIAAAFVPPSLSKTVFKAGFGIFYDKIFLNVADFEEYPDRIVTEYDSNGDPIASTRLFHQLTNDIKAPKSITWNVEVDQQVTDRLLTRVNFLVRRGYDQFLVTPLPDRLLLDNSGRSKYWEVEWTSQYNITQESRLNFSYVRSSSTGDTNDFGSFFGNFERPLIRENSFAPLPFHTPNRFLFWGILKAPLEVYVSPLLEVRNGFPYSVINEAQQFVGPRNERTFPVFAQLDLRITRAFMMFNKYKVTSGFKIFNVLNRFNPRDVQNNIDSDRFGFLNNSLHRTYRIAFEVQY